MGSFFLLMYTSSRAAPFFKIFTESLSPRILKFFCFFYNFKLFRYENIKIEFKIKKKYYLYIFLNKK